ncbi:hypothetical protein LZ575_11655 [Antarcticibacterium sp. 1MA-6-2]|uniref:hypothetical protein n=1 Tax=Antarcticibacterium sp. 1MA-6-2 TaxID=2908210 RepID=UPI001F1AC177|nr:hypothetical protein [Antarcticibacterium sp. 1MA-6-2]UJH89714.1 hypothetical protein LZ575_11655 [Antarcticibacterium sp. 1MA-6-2]
MKKIMLFGLLITFLGVSSCDISDDGSECVIGPVLILIDLVEEGSNENLFSNGTFDKSQFTVVSNNNQPVNHNFLNVDGREYLRIALGETVGENTISLKLNSEVIMDIQYTTALSTGECNNPYITDFDIPEYDFEQLPSTGAIRVYFPLQVLD